MGRRPSTPLGYERLEYARARGYKSWAAYHRAHPGTGPGASTPKTKAAYRGARKTRQSPQFAIAKAERKYTYQTAIENAQIAAAAQTAPSARHFARQNFRAALAPKPRRKRK